MIRALAAGLRAGDAKAAVRVLAARHQLQAEFAIDLWPVDCECGAEVCLCPADVGIIGVDDAAAFGSPSA